MESTTSDADLAAFVIATTRQFPALVPVAGGDRLAFIFDDGNLDALAPNFYAGKARVEPQRFAQARRLLMGRVREAQGRPLRTPQRGGARYGRTGGAL